MMDLLYVLVVFGAFMAGALSGLATRYRKHFCPSPVWGKAENLKYSNGTVFTGQLTTCSSCGKTRVRKVVVEE